MKELQNLVFHYLAHVVVALEGVALGSMGIRCVQGVGLIPLRY
jgi:hypothetical protein